LALAVSDYGVRPALVDLDMGLANADLLLGLQPRFNLSHAVSGLRTLEEISMLGPKNLLFVPGTSGMHDLANLTEFERQNLIVQLQKLDRSADIMFFDCGAGISRNVVAFAHAADETIIVTTPEPTALTDAYAVIKVLRRDDHHMKIGLLINMARSRDEAKRTFLRVASVAQRFLKYSVAEVGFILHDTVVEAAVRERRPFIIGYPNSNASACVQAIASELARTRNGHERGGGFLKRIVGLFV
jgi:flagellar biosynthesis protein FlhG